MRACTYCGCDVDAHDPVCVHDCGDPAEALGQFCNYGCLSAYVDEESLVTGTSCAWSPE